MEPEFDLVDSIQSILADLSEKGFETIDRKVILRNLSAAAGGGFSSESIDNLRKFTADALKKAVEETREAYKRAVDFLATHVGVTSSSVLPYANQLTVLAEVFRLVRYQRLPSFERSRNGSGGRSAICRRYDRGDRRSISEAVTPYMDTAYVPYQ
jgi:hypothetical protein